MPWTTIGRRRAYRRGRPVLIRVRVGPPYQWATHMLCHGSQLWLLADLGRPSERRVELHADGDAVDIGRRHGPLSHSRFLLSANGKDIQLATGRDHRLFTRALRRWQRRRQWADVQVD